MNRLGPYALVRTLGHGGMASVYEAVHVGLGKRVAVKVMQPHHEVETTTARFLREGRAIAKVRHPHVVEVFDVGVHEGIHYLVMEYLDGIDLAALLKARGHLTLEETLEILRPVLAAVSAAHEAGIVHRDIKPANVFLQKERHGKHSPKIVDFGIATFVDKDGDLELTQTNALLGTFRYMAPEQTYGAKHADARSDQYSLGVMLYLCATGHSPYDGEGVYETIHAIRYASFVRPSVHVPSLPAAFDEAIERALSRDPEKRFASVAELTQALAPLVGTADAPRAAKAAVRIPWSLRLAQSWSLRLAQSWRRALGVSAALVATSALAWALSKSPPASAASDGSHASPAPPEVSESVRPSAESSVSPPTPTVTSKTLTRIVARPPEGGKVSGKTTRPSRPADSASPKVATGSNGSPILE